jgi:hypothetical protein
MTSAGARFRTLAALAGTLGALALPTGAAASVHGCGPHVYGNRYPGRILSVRNMSCHGALRVYTRNRGWEHVPLSKGQHSRIGRFRCRVYKDLTQPMQDSWVFIRCVHGRRAFRLEYGV